MNGAIASAPFLKIHANSHSIGKIYKLTVPLPPPSTIPSSLPFPLLSVSLPPLWKRSVLSSWRVPLLSSCCFRRSGNPSGELCAVRLLQVETQWQKEGAQLS